MVLATEQEAPELHPHDDGAARRAPAGVRVVSARERETNRFLTASLAVVATALTGARLDLYPGVTAGEVLGLVLLPFWLPALKHFRGARWVAIAAALAVASGLILQITNPYVHRFSTGNAVTSVSTVAGLVIGSGVLLWARRQLPLSVVLGVVGGAMVLTVDPTTTLFASNPWKFGYALPVALTVLAVMHGVRSKPLQVLAILALAGVGAVSDARSEFGILLVTALLVAWPGRAVLRYRKTAALVLIAVAAAIVAVLYTVLQGLIVSGALGSATAARSSAQLQAAGSLLLGGRPELGATAALLFVRPLGAGPGAVPTPTDVGIAQAGMRAIGYNPDNGYVYSYMFGDRIELHSNFGDLWASFGIGGILLCAVIAVVLVGGLAVGTVTRTAGPAVVLAGVWSVWNLGFSPIGTSALLLTIALGSVAPARAPRAAAPAPGPGRARFRLRGIRGRGAAVVRTGAVPR